MARLERIALLTWSSGLIAMLGGFGTLVAAEDAASASPAAASAGTAAGESRSDPRTFQTQAGELGISPYEPVYFSFGFNERVNAKFQLSLKFRPFGPEKDGQGSDDLWDDLYLAYTQTSIWDLESKSKPFYDTSYRPAVFFQRADIGKLFGGRFGFGGGFEHESNGKSGDESRSINILFIRPSWWWNIDRRWALAFSPKAYTYIEKSENTDIADYRGYVDWNVALAQDRGIRIAGTLRFGTDGHMSAQVDLSYPFIDITPLRAIGLRNGYFHVQYFEGYGETILNYDARAPWQLRFGIMIVR